MKPPFSHNRSTTCLSNWQIKDGNDILGTMAQAPWPRPRCCRSCMEYCASTWQWLL